MMKYNREQIIKALKCCANEGFQDCENCPLNIPHQPCSKVKLPRISFVLIKELIDSEDYWKRQTFDACMDKGRMGDKIKELTEESQKWQEAYDCVDSACRELSSKCDELTEQNERLRFISAHVCVGNVITSEQMEELRMAHILPGMHRDPVGEMGECGMKHKCAAETVRKMQEKIRAKSEYGTINISPWQLDQIAKEILED